MRVLRASVRIELPDEMFEDGSDPCYTVRQVREPLEYSLKMVYLETSTCNLPHNDEKVRFTIEAVNEIGRIHDR